MDEKAPVENLEQTEQIVSALPKHQNRSLIGIIAAVLILVLTGSYFYINSNRNPSTSLRAGTQNLSPTPTIDPTANRKIYTNSEFGFSLQYPSNWLTKELSREDKLKSIVFRPNDTSIKNEDWGMVSITVQENKNNITIDNYINNYLCYAPEICADANKAISITVGGVKAKKVINPPAPVSSQVTVMIKGNKIFTIWIGLDKSLGELYSTRDKEKIYDQILSTFKFTN